MARRRVAVVELGEEEAAYLPTTTTTDPAASFSDSGSVVAQPLASRYTRRGQAKHSETRCVHFLWAFRIAWHAVSLGDLRAV